jgi:hypothetical protein
VSVAELIAALLEQEQDLEVVVADDYGEIVRVERVLKETENDSCTWQPVVRLRYVR